MDEINTLIDIASYMQFITVWYEIHLIKFNIILYLIYIIRWGI